MVWAALAIALSVNVLLRPDALVLTTGERLSGRVLSESSTSLTISPDSSEDAQMRTIRRDEIAQHHRFGTRSVTGVYRLASERWWASEEIYKEGAHGYLYLPQSAIVYSPLTLLPSGLAEVGWRVLGLWVYAWGVWRLTRRMFERDADLAFLVASLLAIPAALGSAANGQTNVLLGGAAGLTAVAVVDRRWWWACAWMAVMVLCKPTALAVVGLVGAAYVRPMWWRLLVTGALGALGLFVHPSPEYAAGQAREFVDKMISAGAPVEVYQDVRGLLVGLNLTNAEHQLSAVRMVGGVLVLGLAFRARRACGGVAAGMGLVALGVILITLFNPRTEGLSYAIVGPMLAIVATRELWERRWIPAIGLMGLCVLLQFARIVTLGEPNTWVRPLGVLVWLAWMALEIGRGRTLWPVGPVAAWDRRGPSDATAGVDRPSAQELVRSNEHRGAHT